MQQIIVTHATNFCSLSQIGENPLCTVYSCVQNFEKWLSQRKKGGATSSAENAASSPALSNRKRKFPTIGRPNFVTSAGHCDVSRMSTPMDVFPPASIAISSTSLTPKVISVLASGSLDSIPLTYATLSPELNVKMPRFPEEKHMFHEHQVKHDAAKGAVNNAKPRRRVRTVLAKDSNGRSGDRKISRLHPKKIS